MEPAIFSPNLCLYSISTAENSEHCQHHKNCQQLSKFYKKKLSTFVCLHSPSRSIIISKQRPVAGTTLFQQNALFCQVFAFSTSFPPFLTPFWMGLLKYLSKKVSRFLVRLSSLQTWNISAPLNWAGYENVFFLSKFWTNSGHKVQPWPKV